jgi:hypothetical protein
MADNNVTLHAVIDVPAEHLLIKPRLKRLAPVSNKLIHEADTTFPEGG